MEHEYDQKHGMPEGNQVLAPGTRYAMPLTIIYRPSEPEGGGRLERCMDGLQKKLAAGVAAVVVLGGLVAGGGATASAAVPGEVALRYGPGRVVSVEELPAELWLPGTGRAHRLRYASTGADGKPTVVSGAVFVPQGKAPKGGWPVVSWAHGTLGVADYCANSTAGRSARDIAPT